MAVRLLCEPNYLLSHYFNNSYYEIKNTSIMIENSCPSCSISQQPTLFEKRTLLLLSS